MNASKVFFCPVNNKNIHDISNLAGKLLEKVIEDGRIVLEKEIPLKVHTGQPGNTTFIKPKNFAGIVNYLLKKNIKTYFIETNMVTGPRSKASTHMAVAKKHGFTKIPVVIADGEEGKDHVEVKISNGKYFKSCKIARKLADKQQVIVLSHFKGHGMAGFGGVIKMLGIGFASRQGKMEVHAKDYSDSKTTIDWGNTPLYRGAEFNERMAEYALAAVNNKEYIYLNFAMDIVANCDCDGEEMTPIYKDLGIFASTDPVAIDKACFDLLEKREGRKPFAGDEVFAYAEKIGLGSQDYELIEVK